ncbi:hypothetical protein ATANTOWER_012806, partial [Ataeniobius toweri]|nr:hypothetical protein [Ataeniobius toweri]
RLSSTPPDHMNICWAQTFNSLKDLQRNLHSVGILLFRSSSSCAYAAMIQLHTAAAIVLVPHPAVG